MSFNFTRRLKAVTLFCSGVGPVALAASSAIAADITQSNELPDDPVTGTKVEVVVTATRTPEPIRNVIGAVSVITREQIEQRQPASVQELLRQEAGVDITSQGGLGKLTAMFMRGTDPKHVLVLIDGVRFGSVTAGTNPLEYLPVDQIERIEVVRGPRSSLYGADAIGGVIQIFTRNGAGGQADVSLGGGSERTGKASGSFSDTWGDAWLSLSGTRYQTDGFNSCRGSLSSGCFTIEPDDDGYKNTSGSLRSGYRWDDRGSVEVGAMYSSGQTQFDGSFTNETNFREFVPNFRGHFKPVDNVDLTLIAGVNHDDQTNLHNGVFSSFFNTERRNTSLQADVGIAAEQMLTVGADYLDDRVESTTLFNSRSRKNKAGFAQYQAGFGAQRVTGSVRYDDNEQFGGHTTGNLGWKWALNSHIYTSAGWGTAFHAPTFNDLYFPGFSNPNLQPETSRSYELGLGGQETNWVWSVNAYQNDVDQLIALNSVFVPANVAEARIRGIELSDTYTVANWDITTNYSWTDPRNRVAGATFDKVLARRVRHSGLLRVGSRWDELYFSVTARAQGRRFNDAANTTALGAYVTLDLTAEYAFAKVWKIEGKIGNALDKNYQTVAVYNEAPRTFFVSVKYSPRW